MTLRDIGFARALALVKQRVAPLPPVNLPVWEAVGLVLAEDAIAQVDSPQVAASSRDGYAVRSQDVAAATTEHPIPLRITGMAVAGSRSRWSLEPGCAIGVTSGAALPEGADAVVSAEFCEVQSQSEICEVRADAASGRNTIPRGADVRAGQLLAAAGTILRPAMTGLLAAGGIVEVRVHPRPRVAVLATGDEVVVPGQPLRPGQIYASNLVTLQGWLHHFGMCSTAAVAPDDPVLIQQGLERLVPEADVLLTSGGAWKSVRDRTVKVVEALGFELVFHRVRLAPGKAVALGVRDREVGGAQVALCLPGGPPSNEMAFLQLGLPALLALAGSAAPAFRTARAVLSAGVAKQRPDPSWTNFFQATLATTDGRMEAEPLRQGSRLVCQAQTEALIVLPEGVLSLGPGEEAQVQIL